MLDLILINDYSRQHQPFSYGKICLTEFLVHKGWRVRLIQPDEIFRLGHDPARFFGLGSWSSDFHRVVETANFLKKNYPKVPVICGGGHITACPGELQAYTDIFDYWVLGEGEVALHEILQGQHQPRTLITRLVPEQDLLPPSIAHSPIMNGSYIGIASRGCPHACTFCNTHTMFGHKTRNIPIEKYLPFLKDLIRKGMVTLSFRDPSFLNNINWATDFCTAVVKEDIKFNWLASCCAEQLTEERVLMMKRAGCIGITIGVESGSQAMLNIMHKTAGLSEMKKAISLCKGNKIHTHLNLMYGIVGETYETMAATREFCRQTKPDSRTLFLYEPFPGTVMFSEAERNNLLSPYNWVKGKMPQLLSTGFMTRAEVIKEADRLWHTGPFHQYLRNANLKMNMLFVPGVLVRVVLLKILLLLNQRPTHVNPRPLNRFQQVWQTYTINLIGKIQIYLHISLLST